MVTKPEQWAGHYQWRSNAVMALIISNVIPLAAEVGERPTIVAAQIADTMRTGFRLLAGEQ